MLIYNVVLSALFIVKTREITVKTELNRRKKVNILMQIAETVEDYVNSVYKVLHQRPELRWQEKGTLDFISRSVSSFKADIAKVTTRSLEGGLVVDVEFYQTFNWILFRADVDALPITEETGLPYASKTPGVMHACGHDMHVAMLLGAVKVLLSGDVKPKHNIRFVFQRAEENPGAQPNPMSGGNCLVQEGVCKGISNAHALHIMADGKPGKFYGYEEYSHCNSDRFMVTIRCSGGHVMEPHIGSNAIDIAMDVAMALRNFKSTHINPNEPLLLVPSVINSGTSSNIRPADANLWYSVRNYLSEERREEVAEQLRKEIGHVVERYGDASFEFSYIEGHPAVKNDPADVARVRCLLQSNELETEIGKPGFGGEDFGYYLREKTGSFWRLGSHQEGTGTHHTPKFMPDPSVLTAGVLFWLILATN